MNIIAWCGVVTASFAIISAIAKLTAGERFPAWEMNTIIWIIYNINGALIYLMRCAVGRAYGNGYSGQDK